MANRSKQAISKKAVEATEVPQLLAWMNRELVPVVEQLRLAYNALATEFRDGLIVIGEGTATDVANGTAITLKWASGAPTYVAADGSQHTNTDNGNFYVRQAGFWVLK